MAIRPAGPSGQREARLQVLDVEHHPGEPDQQGDNARDSRQPCRGSQEGLQKADFFHGHTGRFLHRATARSTAPLFQRQTALGASQQPNGRRRCGRLHGKGRGAFRFGSGAAEAGGFRRAGPRRSRPHSPVPCVRSSRQVRPPADREGAHGAAAAGHAHARGGAGLWCSAGRPTWLTATRSACGEGCSRGCRSPRGFLLRLPPAPAGAPPLAAERIELGALSIGQFHDRAHHRWRWSDAAGLGTAFPEAAARLLQGSVWPRQAPQTIRLSGRFPQHLGWTLPGACFGLRRATVLLKVALQRGSGCPPGRASATGRAQASTQGTRTGGSSPRRWTSAIRPASKLSIPVQSAAAR